MFRMIQHNLCPAVAEKPDELIVYGGTGKAARNWECFDAILDTLKRLNEDETMLIQSGKPVGVFKTHKDAPRGILVNSQIVPHWADWDHFREYEAMGLTMYGQMTAGSAGSTSAPRASSREPTRRLAPPSRKQHFGGTLAGTS